MISAGQVDEIVELVDACTNDDAMEVPGHEYNTLTSRLTCPVLVVAGGPLIRGGGLRLGDQGEWEENH